MNYRRIYDDIQVIKKLSAPDDVKRNLIEVLCKQKNNLWEVIGVTQNALKIFKKYNFERVSGMGINRSHIIDRNKTYQIMLERNLCYEEWKEILIDNDRTILATSKENIKNKFSKIYKFPKKGLFKANKINASWKHGDAEKSYLRILAA